MKKIWSEIKYWSQLLLLPIYGLSCIIPRNKKLWVFGSTFGRRFADNPKYFYLYMTQYQSEQVKAVWISKSKEVIRLLNSHGARGYYLYSLKGIWHVLRAKVYIYDNYSKDICYTLSGGAVKINLWHGIPLKKIQKDNRNDKVRNPRTFGEKFHGIPRRISDEKPSHYVVTTSDFLVPVFQSAFHTGRVINSGGYPRNDILQPEALYNLLTKKEQIAKDEIVEWKNDQGTPNKKVVLYMPTFRDSEKRFLQMLDINRFNEVLKEANILFCIKLHPKSKLRQNIDKLGSEFIKIIDQDADPYAYLNITDILITDYSSIYFDFLLLDRPVLFFCYDLEEYLGTSREMYFDYEEFTPGNKIRTMQELEEVLISAENLADNEHMRQKRIQIRNTVFSHPEEISGERLFRYIQEQILKIT